MKTYQEFIQEDFNSPKATQFKLPVSMGLRPTKSAATTDLMTFYESLPNRSFNLIRYMKSFESNDAKDILKNSTDRWRGLIFCNDSNLLIYVWQSLLLHANLCTALDSNKTGKYPNIGYKNHTML